MTSKRQAPKRRPPMTGSEWLDAELQKIADREAMKRQLGGQLPRHRRKRKGAGLSKGEY